MKRIYLLCFLQFICFVGTVTLVGCEALRRVEEKIPPVEVCLIYKGRELCAVKRDGQWFFKATLSAEERADVEKLLPKE